MTKIHTDFSDRNLYFLRRRVASGMPTFLDGGTPRYLAPTDVALLPVGTLLEDSMPGSIHRWLWVRTEVNVAGEGLLCIYAESPVIGEDAPGSTPEGVGTRIPADRHTSLVIIGSLPGTPAARVNS